MPPRLVIGLGCYRLGSNRTLLHKEATSERQNLISVLVYAARFHVHDAAIGPGLRHPNFKDLALGVDGVALEGGAVVGRVLVFEVRDILP